MKLYHVSEIISRSLNLNSLMSNYVMLGFNGGTRFQWFMFQMDFSGGTRFQWFMFQWIILVHFKLKRGWI